MIQDRILTDEKTTTFLRTQDVTADLERAARLRENLRAGSDLRHVGTVPMVIAEQWSRECGEQIGTAGFNEYLKRKLQDGEFAKLAIGKF